MKRFGDPSTEVQFWIECDAGHPANKGRTLSIDCEGNFVIQGVCECGSHIKEAIPLIELVYKGQSIQKNEL
jgi:hypothetical protein